MGVQFCDVPELLSCGRFWWIAFVVFIMYDLTTVTGALCQFGKAAIICSISLGGRGRRSPTDHTNVPLNGGLYFGQSTMNVAPQ